MNPLLIATIFLWLIGISLYIYSVTSTYQRITKSTKEQTVLATLEKTLKAIEQIKQRIDKLEKRIDSTEHKSILYAQKLGLVRFNPFADTGGDQSFIVTILDGKNDGILLSSLHSRTTTRWYAKSIKDGKAVDHNLSAEEKKAIASAVAGEPT